MTELISVALGAAPIALGVALVLGVALWYIKYGDNDAL